MRVAFIGVGEACDADLPNTSLLLFPGPAASPDHILLDCGFTTPHHYFRMIDNADALQAVWISHFHGDHFFGIPLLLLRFWEMGRAAPLHIVGLEGIDDKTEQAMELAYPGFRNKLRFPIIYHDVNNDTVLDLCGSRWSFAPMKHSRAAMGIRIDTDDKSLFYSGDGRPTPESIGLAEHTDLAVHEAFALDKEIIGHGSISGCIDFGRQARIKRLALVHLNRDEKKGAEEMIDRQRAAGLPFEILLPQPGTTLIL